MSVVEYEHKFNELLRFAPELVAIEDDRRRRDVPGFGGPSQGPSKRGGSSSSSANDRWSGGRGSSSGSGRSGFRPVWTQYTEQQPATSTVRTPSQQTGLTCFSCRQVGHFGKDCPTSIQRGKQGQSSDPTCYLYGQVGHIKRSYPMIYPSDTVVQGTGA
ncbi:unnamed protein product [Prunus armeniaca]